MPSEQQLPQEAREARAAYRREWNKKNPKKNKEYIARYWQRKALEMLKSQQEEQANDAASANNE